MNGIQNTPVSGKPVQYGKFTFLDISDQLVKSDKPPDLDKMVPVTDSPEKQRQFWGRFYSDAALSRSPVAGVKAEIDQESEAVINDFFDGRVSEAELSEKFQSLFSRFAESCQDAGYPIPLVSKGTNQVMLDSFYSEFRRKILDTAVQRNNQEGKQYLTGEMNAQRNWKYYNSDYYFQSEKALGAITDGVKTLAQDKAYEGFTLRDYKAEGLNLYYNFNTAVSNNISADEQYILNPDQVPPEHFQWFYQSGGDSSRRVFSVDGLIVTDPDGRVVEYYDYRPTSFDPTDHRTGTTWAKYQDSQGIEHFVAADFLFGGTKADLHNVAALLNFTSGDKAQNAAVNRFLGNLQLYNQGYFSRFPQGGGVSLQA